MQGKTRLLRLVGQQRPVPLTPLLRTRRVGMVRQRGVDGLHQQTVPALSGQDGQFARRWRRRSDRHRSPQFIGRDAKSLALLRHQLRVLVGRDRHRVIGQGIVRDAPIEITGHRTEVIGRRLLSAHRNRLRLRRALRDWHALPGSTAEPGHGSPPWRTRPAQTPATALSAKGCVLRWFESLPSPCMPRRNRAPSMDIWKAHRAGRLSFRPRR